MCQVVVVVGEAVFVDGASGIEAEVGDAVAEGDDAASELQVDAGLRIPAQHPGVPAPGSPGGEYDARLGEEVYPGTLARPVDQPRSAEHQCRIEFEPRGIM